MLACQTRRRAEDYHYYRENESLCVRLCRTGIKQHSNQLSVCSSFSATVANANHSISLYLRKVINQNLSK